MSLTETRFSIRCEGIWSHTSMKRWGIYKWRSLDDSNSAIFVDTTFFFKYYLEAKLIFL